jgi:hypothetical protein
MLWTLTLSLLLVGAAVAPQQQDGTCTTSGGQFGQRLTACRSGDTVCTTDSHGGDAYREYYARSELHAPGVRLPPTPTAAELLPQQAAGPPIPGRGGPRWEGDDGR